MSGYSTRSWNIVTFQRALGSIRSVLTSPKHPRPGSEREEIGGIVHHRTPASIGRAARVPYVGELAQMARMAGRIAAVAREEKAAVIHAHSPVLNGLPALWAGRRLGLPVVYEARAFWEDAAVDHGTTHEGSARYRVTRALETLMFKRADRVVVIAAGMRTELARRGVVRARVSIVPNGVDTERFSPMARDEELARSLGLNGAPLLGFIGSFYHYKGLRFLVEAMPELRKRLPGARVLLVGGGLPFSFDAGMNQLTTAIQQGGTIVLLKFSARADGRMIAERVTGLAGVPPLWSLLAQPSSTLKAKSPPLRYITNTGGAMPQNVLANCVKAAAADAGLPDVRFDRGVSLDVSAAGGTRPPADVDGQGDSEYRNPRRERAGRALRGGRSRRVGASRADRFHGLLGPARADGQGAAVHPVSPRRAFRRRRGCPTRETLCGPTRTASCTSSAAATTGSKSSGFRISPTEVEEVLFKSGLLKGAAVIGIPDEVLGQAIKAFVVTRDGEALDVDGLREFCSRSMPRHMVPIAIEALDEMPKTTSGKVDYPALRRREGL